MTAKPQPSLKEWAAANSRTRKPTSFIERLPQDLVDQIYTAAGDPTITNRDIVEWLHSLGYTEATESKVRKYYTAVRQGRL